MGMFDYVNFEMECPACGTNMSGFQSKDSHCELLTVDPQAVSRMYSQCPSCKKWVELVRKEEPEKPRSEPYTFEEVSNMGFKLIDT